MGYVVKTLEKHPAAKCEVRIYDNGTIEMVSYTTKIVKATPYSRSPGVILYCIEAVEEGRYSDPNEESRIYSPTTARQISAFLQEYFVGASYANFKLMAEGKRQVPMIAELRRIM